MFQLDRLNAVWRHAASHVPYYRELSTTESLPDSFSSMAEFRHAVPVLPSQVLRERGRKLYSERARPGRWHVTGGATGPEVPVFREKTAYVEGRRARHRHAQMWGSDTSDRMACLKLAADDPSSDAIVRSLERTEAFGPTSIHALSSCAYLLARAAEDVRPQIPSLRYVLVTGEPAFPHMVRAIERAFRVPAINRVWLGRDRTAGGGVARPDDSSSGRPRVDGDRTSRGRSVRPGGHGSG